MKLVGYCGIEGGKDDEQEEEKEEERETEVQEGWKMNPVQFIHILTFLKQIYVVDEKFILTNKILI